MYVMLFGTLVLGACVLAILAGRRRFRTLVTADVGTLFSNAAASVGPDQLLPEGEFSDVRFRVTTLEYNVADRFVS